MDVSLLSMFAGGIISLAGLAVFAARRARTLSPQITSDHQRLSSWEAEHRKTQVEIIDGLLSVTYSKGHIKSFDLSTVQHVSVVTKLYAGLPLHTVEVRKNRSAPVQVPVLAEGFSLLLAHFRQIPGFDETEYGKALRETKRTRHILLQKPLAVNATLNASRSPDVLRQEFERGFSMWVVHEERWLSLEDTVEGFARKSDASFDRNEFDFGVLHAGPIRFGDLQLDEWQTYCPDGPANRPLKTLHRDVVLAQGDSSYWELKRYFSSFLGTGQGWERSDSNQWQYKRNGVLVELTYWYNSDYAVESESCSLRLTNLRNYPQYLVDAYSDQVDLIHVNALTLPYAVQGPTREFRRTHWVKETPPAILSLLQRGEGFIVWNDRKNLRIGFASGREALIVPYEECGEIQLLNAKPAKGGGYSQLRIREASGNDTGRAFVAGQAAFNELATEREKMELTLGFPIKLDDNLYDD